MRRCDLGVVPFGETVLYRVPAVARDRHQALEERWAKGIWLGHTRHTPEVLIGTQDGIVKAYAVRRLAPADQWDGELLKTIRGSPVNWELDSGSEPQMVSAESRVVWQAVGALGLYYSMGVCRGGRSS